MGPKRAAELFPLEIELKIAYEVERRPILWDTRCAIYKRADLKPAVWEEVAKSLGLGYSGVAVSHRFKNMRDTYMNNLRKVREFEKKHSGSGTDDVFKPKWPLYSVLSFLEKTNVKAPSISNIPATNTQLSTQEFTPDATLLESEILATLDVTPSNECVLISPVRNFSAIPSTTSAGSSDNLIASPPGIYYDETLKKFVSLPPDDCGDENTTIESISETAEEIQESVIPPRPSSAPTPGTAPKKRTCPIIQQEDRMFEKKG